MAGRLPGPSVRAHGISADRAATRTEAITADWIRNELWYLPVVLLPVVTLGATYGLMVATGWQFQHQPALSPTTMLLFVPVYVLAAAGEELGWSGYVIEPLEHRFGALGGSCLLYTSPSPRDISGSRMPSSA